MTKENTFHLSGMDTEWLLHSVVEYITTLRAVAPDPMSAVGYALWGPIDELNLLAARLRRASGRKPGNGDKEILVEYDTPYEEGQLRAAQTELVDSLISSGKLSAKDVLKAASFKGAK